MLMSRNQQENQQSSVNQVRWGVEYVMKPLEDIQNEYENSIKAQELKLSFKEYALLYRYFEGVSGLDLNESLYLSRPTIQRYKKNIIKIFVASSFEQALILAGSLLFQAERELKLKKRNFF